MNDFADLYEGLRGLMRRGCVGESFTPGLGPMSESWS